MIKRFAGRALVVAMTCLAASAFAAEPATDAAAPVQLAEDHPTSYTVQPGDTLWGIAEKFLKSPWQWPSVWHVNEQVANPHLIYPGDVLRLTWVNGQPSLSRDGGTGYATENAIVEVIDGNTVKLRPRIRESELATAIPAIPLRSIEVLLNDSRVTTLDELKKASYVVAGPDRRVIMGNDDTMYARSTTRKWDEAFPEFGVFRQGNAYLDPVTKEILGYEAKKVGTARVLETDGPIATMRVLKANEDIRINDRLLLNEQLKVQSVYYPRSAPAGLDATIIHIFGTIGYAGRGDVLVLNKGMRDKVDVGHVFAVLQKGETVRDRLAGDAVQLPPTRAGLAIIFRSFDKVAYALVTRSRSAIRVGDLLAPPRIDID